MAVITDRPHTRFHRRLSALMWIVAVNAALFVLLRLIAAIGVLGGHGQTWADAAVRAVSMPSGLAELAERPWTAAIYMVAQFDPMHLLLNMMILLWFGLTMTAPGSGRRIATVYTAGGLAGAAAYIVAGLLAGVDPRSSLIGASASVMAVAAAVTVAAPDRRMRLLFVGEVRVKWIAAGLAVMAAIGFSGHSLAVNAAHCGGIAAGIVAGMLWRRADRPMAAAEIAAPAAPLTDMEQLDSLLDKVRRSGYESLDTAERATLFTLSQRLKDQRQ